MAFFYVTGKCYLKKDIWIANDGWYECKLLSRSVSCQENNIWRSWRTCLWCKP